MRVDLSGLSTMALITLTLALDPEFALTAWLFAAIAAERTARERGSHAPPAVAPLLALQDAQMLNRELIGMCLDIETRAAEARGVYGSGSAQEKTLLEVAAFLAGISGDLARSSVENQVEAGRLPS